MKKLHWFLWTDERTNNGSTLQEKNQRELLVFFHSRMKLCETHFSCLATRSHHIKTSAFCEPWFEIRFIIDTQWLFEFETLMFGKQEIIRLYFSTWCTVLHPRVAILLIVAIQGRKWSWFYCFVCSQKFGFCFCRDKFAELLNDKKKTTARQSHVNMLDLKREMNIPNQICETVREKMYHKGKKSWHEQPCVHWSG